MARFGRKTAISGLVGNDIGGRFLVDGMERENINTDAVAVRDGFESQTSVIVVENGRRTIFEAPQGVGFAETRCWTHSRLARPRSCASPKLLLRGRIGFFGDPRWEGILSAS